MAHYGEVLAASEERELYEQFKSAEGFGMDELAGDDRELLATPMRDPGGTRGSSRSWRPPTGDGTGCTGLAGSAAELSELRRPDTTCTPGASRNGVEACAGACAGLGECERAGTSGTSGNSSMALSSGPGLSWQGSEQRLVGKKASRRAQLLSLMVSDCSPCSERRRDAVDHSINQSKGLPASWERPAHAQLVDKDAVTTGIWRFEQRAGLVRNQYEGLSKAQILAVIDNLPVKIPTLLREADDASFPSPPKSFAACSKAQLVEWLITIERLCKVVDAKRVEQEKAELAAAFAGDDSDAEEAAELEGKELEEEVDDDDQDLEEAKGHEEEQASDGRITFRTRSLGDSGGARAVTPRQAFLIQQTFFNKK